MEQSLEKEIFKYFGNGFTVLSKKKVHFQKTKKGISCQTIQKCVQQKIRHRS